MSLPFSQTRIVAVIVNVATNAPSGGASAGAKSLRYETINAGQYATIMTQFHVNLVATQVAKVQIWDFSELASGTQLTGSPSRSCFSYFCVA